MATSETATLPTWSSSRNAATSILAVQLLLIGLILMTPLLTIEDGSLLIHLTCGAFILFTGWLLWSWRRLTDNWLDPYTLFLIAAITFNGGQFILQALHLNEFGILDGRFGDSTIVKSIFLTVSGLAALHLGAVMAWLRYAAQGGRLPCSLSTLKPTKVVGWCLIAVSIVPAVLVIDRDIGRVVEKGYAALYGFTPVIGYERAQDELAHFIVPGMLFLIAGSRPRSLAVRFSVVLMAVYSLAGLFLGSRAGALTGAVGYIWLYHRLIRRVPAAAFVTLAGLLVIILPTIGLIRNTTGEQRTTAALFVDAMLSQANPAVALIHEMGNSVRATASTIQLVPDIRSFEWGETYLWGTTTVFPNVFWSVHPAVAHTHLAEWLVQTVEPETAAKSGGLGFSFIAEAYLNFGWYGAPLSLLLLGYLWGGLVVRVEASKDPVRMAMLAAMLAPMLVFPRGESSDCIRGIVWYGVVPCLLTLATKTLYRSSGAQSRHSVPGREAQPRCAFSPRGVNNIRYMQRVRSLL
jgi:oligosaccharide repeat unit polymerase